MKRVRYYLNFVFIVLAFAVSTSISYADLYLSSRVGNVFFNTSGTGRMQVTSGGDLILLGLSNMTIPGNLTVDSGTFFVDSVNDRVGIGILNATSYLDVRGSTSGASSLRVQTGAEPSSPKIGDIYSDGTDLFYYDGSGWKDLTTEATAGAGGFTDDGSTVRLTSISDFVGIGTTSPTEKLYVSGNGTYTGDLVLGGDLISSGTGTGGASGAFGWVDNGGAVVLAESTDNVGIGTSSPVYTFQTGVGTDGKSVNLSDVLYVNGSSGNVGIGTSSPDSKLEIVNGGIRFSGTPSFGSGTDAGIIGGAGDYLRLITNGDSRVAITSSGDVGIGTNSPGTKLHVSGGIIMLDNNQYLRWKDVGGAQRNVLVLDSNNDVILHSASSSQVLKINDAEETSLIYTYSDTVGATNRDLYIDNTGKLGYVSSSIRYKENIENLTDTSWLYSLRPVSFDFKDKSKGINKMGLIAEEVELVYPGIVSYNYYENGTKEVETVNYGELNVPILKELQELKKENDMLKEELCIESSGSYSWC